MGREDLLVKLYGPGAAARCRDVSEREAGRKTKVSSYNPNFNAAKRREAMKLKNRKK